MFNILLKNNITKVYIYIYTCVCVYVCMYLAFNRTINNYNIYKKNLINYKL